MRKCKEIGEVAVMEMAEIGMRMTRARAALAMAAATATSTRTSKSKKVSRRKLDFSSSLTQLRRRRRVSVTPENLISPATSVNSTRPTTSSAPRASPSSDQVIASCCSSNGSSQLANEIVNFVDLEEESSEIETSRSGFNCRETERRETPEDSGELESTAGHTVPNSTVEKMPSEAEVEEFFTTAEKNLQKSFTEKYNFDIVKDVALEGRYEWVQVQLKQ